MLEIRDLNAFYGKLQVLWNVSLQVREGEIVAIVGSNGAGKTTLLHSILGLVRPASGSVTFLGRRIDGLPSYAIAEMGVTVVPEGGRVFPEMSVRENLEMGAYPHRAWERRKEALKYVYQLFPRLKERERQLARTLSGGERQMLAIGRALMSRPKLCLFDEPSYGLAPVMVKEIFEIIQKIREQGVTVLLVEQNVRRALEIADRAYVLENGRICMEGECAELLESDHIKKAYLGM
ncbi:MAG: ABC transporter ATP-binding protein [Anaerolineae bacterium]|nr:ABC transporter ATP-binding protein [Anaerolineae bacterium]MCX8068542.1 ABC transporter ATP-binding protein [Anaerolineae bacterium]MDW7991796.1 ABC transporter ATP-binding protein [Anaerolineae bacterium]